MTQKERINIYIDKDLIYLVDKEVLVEKHPKTNHSSRSAYIEKALHYYLKIHKGIFYQRK